MKPSLAGVKSGWVVNEVYRITSILMEKGLTCCQCFFFCFICCHYCFFCWNEKLIFLKISFILSCESSSEKSQNSILAKSRNSRSQFEMKSLVLTLYKYNWITSCQIFTNLNFPKSLLKYLGPNFNPISPGGGHIWPPLVKIQPEQKIGPGRRPGLLGL